MMVLPYSGYIYLVEEIAERTAKISYLKSVLKSTPVKDQPPLKKIIREEQSIIDFMRYQIGERR